MSDVLERRSVSARSNVRRPARPILQLGSLRATTADGIAARARCLAVHNSDGAFSMQDPNTTLGWLLRWLMRDAGALGGTTNEPAVSPDAELLRCVQRSVR